MPIDDLSREQLASQLPTTSEKVESAFLATVALAHINMFCSLSPLMTATYGQRVGDVMAIFGLAHHYHHHHQQDSSWFGTCLALLMSCSSSAHAHTRICRCPLLWPLLHLCHLLPIDYLPPQTGNWQQLDSCITVAVRYVHRAITL